MLFRLDKYTTRQLQGSVYKRQRKFHIHHSIQPQHNKFNPKSTNTLGFQPAAWKSPKSSSGMSCELSVSWVSDILDCKFSETGDLSSECSSRLKLDGESTGEFGAVTEGESGANGGGGGLRQIIGSFPVPLSSREILFKPCSKNLDRTLPPPFCQQDQWTDKEDLPRRSCHSKIYVHRHERTNIF